MKRQYYVDNLRWIWILLLIPFHAAMAWNTWEGNYIWFCPNKPLSTFVIMVCPFYMPLLFVLAGMSMRFALQKRSMGAFLGERVRKLLIPLLSGLVTVVAYMAYMADRFHNAYEGGFFAHFGKFFTRLTDFTGYDGCFTPAHLWFLLFLFIASLLLLLVIALQRRFFPAFSCKQLKLWALLSLCVFPIACSFILDFGGGKSIGESFALVALGYYVFAESEVVEQLSRYKYVLLCLAFTASCAYAYVFVWLGDLGSPVCYIGNEISQWCGVLGFLGLGKCLMDKDYCITRYMRSRCFLLYIFHFGWIVFLQNLLSRLNLSVALCYCITVPGALALTLLTAELIIRTPGIRFLFGAKKPAKEPPSIAA